MNDGYGGGCGKGGSWGKGDFGKGGFDQNKGFGDGMAKGKGKGMMMKGKMDPFWKGGYWGADMAWGDWSGGFACGKPGKGLEMGMGKGSWEKGGCWGGGCPNSDYGGWGKGCWGYGSWSPGPPGWHGGGGCDGSGWSEESGWGLGDSGHGIAADCNKLFVGGLPKSTTEEAITEHFSQFGPVTEVLLKKDPTTGANRGFAFVTFESPDSATAVLQNRGGNRFEDRWIDCKPAVPDESSSGGKGKGSGKSGKWDWGKSSGGADFAGFKFGGGKGASSTEITEKIYVASLPTSTTTDTLKNHFSQFGDVKDVVLKYEPNGAFRGFGFVTFSTVEAAKLALEDSAAGGFVLDGTCCSSKPAIPDAKVGKSGKGAKSQGAPPSKSQPSPTKIFVGCLPLTASEEAVMIFFSQFGQLKEVHLERDEVGGLRGFGYVNFESAESARAVLKNYRDDEFEPLEFEGQLLDCKAADTGSGDAINDNDTAEGPETNVMRVKGLPPEPKQRDVFKFFYNYSVMRIRDTGDDILVEFTSDSECKRAFKDKRGMKMGQVFPQLSGATQEDLSQAAALQQAAFGDQWARDLGRGPVKRNWCAERSSSGNADGSNVGASGAIVAAGGSQWNAQQGGGNEDFLAAFAAESAALAAGAGGAGCVGVGGPGWDAGCLPLAGQSSGDPLTDQLMALAAAEAAAGQGGGASTSVGADGSYGPTGEKFQGSGTQWAPQQWTPY